MNGRRAYLLFVFLLVLLVFGVGTKIVSAAESPAETAESGETKEVQEDSGEALPAKRPNP